MELKETRLARTVNLYLSRKNKELSLKKRQETIEAITKALIIDKTPKQSIDMLKEVIEIFNNKMDDKLEKSIEDVEVISKYKKIPQRKIK